MNATKDLHPSAAELASFASGRASEEVAAEISAHLAGCAACRTAAEALPADTLLSLLREPPPATEADGLCDRAARGATTLPGVPGPAAADRELPPELADHLRYHVLDWLGSGGMGAVYKAEHRLMERPVALKFLNPGLTNRPALVERFRREVKAAARLSHPNIVLAYDADQAGGVHFLVMEFVEGVSLAEHVERHGPLPVAEACEYARQAALGLQYAAERGMVHRDIKPHNLMLTTPPLSPPSQGGEKKCSPPYEGGDKGGVVKILDFGLARFVREETAEPDGRAGVPEHAGGAASPLTEVGTLMGTADFIAPEQAADSRRADSRADVYSLGCTLYYLLAGKAPFPGGTAADKLTAHRGREPVPLTKLRGDIPSALTAVVGRMMAKDPARRYQTAGEAAEALWPFNAAAAARRRGARKAALAAAAVFAATALLGAVVYVQTNNGELVIEAKGDEVALLVNDKGVTVRDLAGRREYLLKVGRHRLRPGEYRIDVRELPAGVVFSAESFSLKRGDNTLVSVSFDARRVPGYLKDEALRWFPADATFFLVMDMETFPELGRLPFLIMADRAGGDFRRFLAMIGRIDRTAYAYADNRRHPDEARSFMRLTGKITRDRVIDHFRQQWKDAFREEQMDGGNVILLHDARSNGSALALIGTTDVLVANFHGHAKNDLPLVKQCLDLRAGRGTALPSAWAATLKEIPDDAWNFAAGEAPEWWKNLYTFPFMRPIRTAVMWLRGRHDVEIFGRGAFGTAEEAKRFRAVVGVMKGVFLNAPAVTKDPELAAAVAKAFDSIKVETDGERFTASVRVPGRAWAAFVEKIADTPLKEIIETPALNPVGKK